MRGVLSRRGWLAAAGWAGLGAGGGTVANAQNVRRIVAVGGAITETLYALGAEAELVGVDTTSLYPAAATRLPSVGYARALSAEGVLSLRPTLVLVSGEAGPPVVLRQLEAARVPLQVLDADHRIEGLLVRTRRIGQLVGRAEAGAALAAEIQRQWQATLARVAVLQRGVQGTPAQQRGDQQMAASARGASRGAALPPGPAGPRVLFVLSHAMNQLRIGGRGTAADAVIGYAGARNAFADVDGFKPLTPEAAIAAAPDVLLVTDQGLQAAGGIDGLLTAPGLAATPAGRARRVVSLEAMWLLGFGPRLPQAVAQLAERLHRVPGA